MIASGKSTWAQRRVHEGWLVINNDSLLMSVCAGQYRWSDDFVRLAIQLHPVILKHAANERHGVVIDNTNRRADHRKAVLTLAHDLGFRTRAVLFPRHSPEEHARRRVNSDPRGKSYEYWLDVARSHAAEWDDPALNEFDESLALQPNWRDGVQRSDVASTIAHRRRNAVCLNYVVS